MRYRLHTGDEIAGLACLICPRTASYLTVQTIVVDIGFALTFLA
jgi:hypothetical protein